MKKKNVDKIVAALEGIQAVQGEPDILDNQPDTQLYDALTSAYDSLMRVYAQADRTGFLDYIRAASEDEILPYLI